MSTALDLPGNADPFDRTEIVTIGFLARYGERTREGYAVSLRQWFQWCEDRGIRPLEATRAHIEVWAREREERHRNERSTVAGKLNAVCGFYRFAWLDKYITDNPAEFVNRPHVPKNSKRKALNRGELLRCLDIAQAGHPQDHALLCILGLHGLRIDECLSRNVEHLGRTGGYRTLEVDREKDNEGSPSIPLVPRSSYAVEVWIGSRNTGPLFLMPRGDGMQRMDRTAAQRIIDRIVIKGAGIKDKRITCHSFRHGFITMALNAGCSIRDLQNTMGYADARPLTTYDRDKDNLSRNSAHSVAAYVEGA